MFSQTLYSVFSALALDGGTSCCEEDDDEAENDDDSVREEELVCDEELSWALYSCFVTRDDEELERLEELAS